MKRWILVMMCAFLYVMPVNATELGAEGTSEVERSEEVIEEIEVEESVSEENTPDESSAEGSEDVQVSSSQTEEASSEVADSSETESSESESIPETTEEATTEESTGGAENLEVEIPDVTGMSEAEALAAIEAVVLPDGSKIEIIKEYKYTNDAEKDIVFEQTLSGVVTAEEAKKVTIVISLGVDPNETVVDGITEPLNQTIVSRFGIDWESLPVTYEYNWDNSQNCWVNGVWIDDVKYLTPENTYNTNVRHKVQLHTDGEYVYCHIVFSRDYEAKANGSDYRFYIDGQEASFQVEVSEGVELTHNNLGVGTHQLRLSHRNSSLSYFEAPKGEAYYTVFDSGVNAHLEMKISLEEMKAQNPNIDIDNVAKIEVYNPNLMMGKITASGASTFPFATAAAALILVPGSAALINRKKKSAKKEADEK